MKTGKLTLTALLLSLSFAISLLEAFVPIGAVIPIPGLKLGFANIAVMAAYLLCGKRYAFCITVFRPLLTFVLFGNVTSFILSLSGGVLAFLGILSTFKLYGKVFSFGGISVISALLHSTGQIFAATVVVADTAVIAYLPLLAAASAVTGLFNGFIMNVVLDRLRRAGRTV